MANPISKLNLVINGVTTQLDVHDPDALTTEIDSSGTGWVRFKSGLQICYGAVVNDNNFGTGLTRRSYPVAFSAIPSVVATANVSTQGDAHFATVTAESETNFIVCSWWAPAPSRTSSNLASYYVAIGKWK